MTSLRDPMSELRARLRALHLEIGGPSYDELRMHASHAGRNLPTSTTNDLLRGRVLSRWRTVETFLGACQRYATSRRLTLSPDTFDLASWQAAHREGLGPAEAGGRQDNPIRPPTAMVPPRQLPAAPRLFVGRADELGRISASVGAREQQPQDAMQIMVIGGAGGVGKTSLALHWAHQQVDRFPDGQIYLDLHGFTLSAGPMSPASAVRVLLDAFGVDPPVLPSGLDAQVALYRSLTSGKRMLIVLDNAHDSAQVLPLLPGSPTCTVLLTSRNQLTGLITTHGARPLVLDPLAADDAHALLAGHLGQRATTEPDAVDALLDSCAGLPLAITIVAARLATHPGLPLSMLADELSSVTSRLDALDAGEVTANLRAVFSSSHRDLSPGAARLFALLGLSSGPDISIPAAASLAGLSPARTRGHLHELDRICLVNYDSDGRYRMHDLVRLYAAEQAVARESTDSQHAARRRLVDFYLHTANVADDLLDPQMQPIEIHDPARGCTPHHLRDRAAALAWFITEHACLLAIQRDVIDLAWDADIWQLAWVLDSFQSRRGHLHDNEASWEAALGAAERLADPTTLALVRRYYGRACARAGHTEVGVQQLRAALAHTAMADDLAGTAHTHYSLAWAWALHGDHEQGLTHATRALHLFQQLGNPMWEARLLTMVATYNARLGHYEAAPASCEHVLVLHRAHRDHGGEIDALDNLGFVAHHAGECRTAIRYYLDAIDLCHQSGHRYTEADVLTRLGDAYASLGQLTDARSAWSRALTRYRAQYRTAEVQAVRRRLAPDTVGA
jgi:tetratricopeptide (TPR) repeat protein